MLIKLMLMLLLKNFYIEGLMPQF